mmetsp:Transcript_28881/g.68446  ORF Transcript_28881/g.68446 Transcript_28881/m.68446 type:complete len:201 (+) Transcript_28881:281-883(+)
MQPACQGNDGVYLRSALVMSCESLGSMSRTSSRMPAEMMALSRSCSATSFDASGSLSFASSSATRMGCLRLTWSLYCAGFETPRDLNSAICIILRVTTLSCSEMMAGESTRRWVASTSDTREERAVFIQASSALPSSSSFFFSASSFCFSSSTLRCAAGIRTSMLVTLYVSLSSMARFLVVTSMSNTSVPGPHAASSHAL